MALRGRQATYGEKIDYAKREIERERQLIAAGRDRFDYLNTANAVLSELEAEMKASGKGRSSAYYNLKRFKL